MTDRAYMELLAHIRECPSIDKRLEDAQDEIDALRAMFDVAVSLIDKMQMDRDRLKKQLEETRQQLQKIGRKAFWASK